MLEALRYAFVDSINVLLIGVIVAVGIATPPVRRKYAKISSLLVAGDWLGVASLSLLMLVIFDGLGDVVKQFVEGPLFGWLLIATGVLVGVMAFKGGDNSKLMNTIMAPLREPTPRTVIMGFILGLIQSATSVPFYAGLAVLSASGIETVSRYTGLILYATVALSLPTITALLVGWIRKEPQSFVGKLFEKARQRPDEVTLAASWLVAILLIAIGVLHFF
ncbi:GAP family protein [Corynebacterium breve]|uniref:GAP family protein n=1 Tax=Corynebacterium breve TaxID=3049799 RepID=A0ABY8VKQ7_9CORY|nr:GAP family protein [Corynebacterium breve]WIM68150.1 GAP family protein [Corynebacterium breve]